MSLIQTIILGIVEGITEFLPVSSTGHLILANKLLGVPDSEFVKSFEIAIQLGAILSVVVLYWKKALASRDIWKKVALAFIPTAILGFIFYKIIKTYLLSSSVVVLWSLLLGGIALIVFELWYKSQTAKNQPISPKRAVAIGVFQSIAMIPGVSRSAATIVGGLSLGVSREKIVEFSFLLAVPTMAAATGYDLYKNINVFDWSQIYYLTLGFIISFIVALLSIKWLLGYIKNHTFIAFGVYRILAAALFWFFIIR